MKHKIIKAFYGLVVALVGFIGSFFEVDDHVAQALAPAGDTVSVISVGQADSALISSGGKFCLIDAGQTQSGHTTVIDYLDSAGVKEIELLVVTHFHTDHTSELIDILDFYDVKNIVIPNLEQQNVPTTSFFDIFLDRAEMYDINIVPAKKGDSYTVGNGTLTIVDDTYNDLTVNDTSVATLFTQGDFTFLSTGDGEEEYEQRLEQVINQKVTLFTAGHHGSSTSNTKAFIEKIQPQFVAISAGKDNEYGHPHREVTDLLEEKGVQYNMTFKDGTLVYSIDNKTLFTTLGGSDVLFGNES